MSLFPGIKVDGHGYKEGLDPNGGSLQSVIDLQNSAFAYHD